MCLSKNHLIRLFLTILFIKFRLVRAECDVCQSSNEVACHSETVFSLCINGTATHDYITCPEGYVCTADYLVCYPKQEDITSCPRPYVIPEDHISSCGMCNGPDKVFSCISERKIAFCFGQNEPNYEYTAICPEGSVCDLRNKNEFCTNATEVEPSCIVIDETKGKTTIRQNDPTYEENDSSDMISIATQMTSTEVPAIPTVTTTSKTSIEDSTTETTTAETTRAKESTTAKKPIIKNSSTILTTTTKQSTTTTKPTVSSTEPNKTKLSSTKPTTAKPTTSSSTTTAKATAIKTTTTNSSTQTTITETPKMPTNTTRATTTSMATTKNPPRTTVPTTESTTTETTTTEGTTTSRLPRDPTAICKEIGEAGLSYPLDNDTVCTQFVMCYISNNVIRGLKLSCAQGMYFDPNYGVCKSEKPSHCV